MKINLKLSGLFIVLSLIVVSISAYVFFIQGSKAIEERMEAQLESIIVLKENQLNYFIKEEVEDIESIVNEFFVNSFVKMMEVHSANKPDEIYHENIRTVFRGKLDDKDFIEFFILHLDGEVHISTDKTQEGKLKPDRPYFIEGKKETFVQDFYYSISLQEPAITISTPIKDSKGDVIGILAGRVNPKEISDVMTERSGLGETGETYLVNKFNIMATESRFEKGLAFKKAIYTGAVKDCLKGNNGHIHHENYRGYTAISQYIWIPEREACLLAEISEEEALEPIRVLKTTVILVSIVVIILAVLLAFFFSKGVTSPVIKLRDSAIKIGKGNLDTKIEIKSKDEIGELAQTFNEMRIGLKDRNQLLNSLLTSFKGKFGKIATILVRKDVQKLVNKNPRIGNILPKNLGMSIKKAKTLKKSK